MQYAEKIGGLLHVQRVYFYDYLTICLRDDTQSYEKFL